MKTKLLFSTLCLAALSSYAQSDYTKQYFFTSGENSFAVGNNLKVGIVKNGKVEYIDSLRGGFGNSVKVYFDETTLRHEGWAHVGRPSNRDLVVRYDLDTYKAVDSLVSSGVQAIARNKTKLVIGKGYGASGAMLEVYNPGTLVLEGGITEIKDEITDVEIWGDSAFVSHSAKGKTNVCAQWGYVCYDDTIGYLSIVNLKSLKVDETISLGTKGASINQLILDKPADRQLHIYFSNGGDSVYKVTNRKVVHSLPYTSILALSNENIYGFKNSSPKLTAVTVNKFTENAEEKMLNLKRINDPRAIYDTVSHSFVILQPAYGAKSKLFIANVNGSVDSLLVGAATSDIEVDYRKGTPTSFLSSSRTLVSKLYPNPCKDVLTINNSKGFSLAVISTLEGKMVEQYELHLGENKMPTSELNNGIYVMTLKNEKGQETLKFIKE